MSIWTVRLGYPDRRGPEVDWSRTAHWELHVEARRGYWPIVRLRRVPRVGDRLVDGGLPGTLVRCPECEDGLLLLQQQDAPGTPPMGADEVTSPVRVPARSWIGRPSAGRHQGGLGIGQTQADTDCVTLEATAWARNVVVVLDLRQLEEVTAALLARVALTGGREDAERVIDAAIDALTVDTGGEDPRA